VMSKAGPVEKVWIARNPPGFGYVTFEDPRDAKDACLDFDGREICGKRVRVEVARRGGRRSPPRGRSRSPPPRRYDDRRGGVDPDRVDIERGAKVFIGNLSDRTEKEDLEDFFRNAGKITKIWLARSPPGYGFVTFEDPRDAEDCVADLDGREIHGNKVRIELAHGKGPSGGGGPYGGGGRRFSPPPRRRSRSPYGGGWRRRSRSRDRRRSPPRRSRSPLRGRSPLPRGRSPPPRGRYSRSPPPMRGRSPPPRRSRSPPPRRSGGRSRSPRR